MTTKEYIESLKYKEMTRTSVSRWRRRTAFQSMYQM